MKKIMFNDTYNLMQAVLSGTKIMTRRLLKKEGTPLGNWQETEKMLSYKVGEVVAIAQSYKAIYDELEVKGNWVANEWWCDAWDVVGGNLDTSAGYTNKMFVRADLMIHHIKITDVRVERLQDISEEDCLCEGIIEGYDCYNHFRVFKILTNGFVFDTARQAFASLIDKTSGKGTWKCNPWVIVYTFERVD